MSDHGTEQWVVLQVDSWLVKSDDLIEDDIPITNIHSRGLPIISVRIGNRQIKSLVDTGSSISVISKALFEDLKEKSSIPVIPVSNLKIRGIIPDRSVRCKEQTYLELQIGDAIFSYPFVVMSKINFNLILGADFLREFDAVIDLPNNEIRFRKADAVERTQMEDENIRERGIFGINADAAIKKENSSGDEKEIIGVYSAEEMHHVMDKVMKDDESVDDLSATLKRKVDNSIGSEEDKIELMNLLSRHQDVFNSKPGKIPNFCYSLLVNDWSPYKQKIYPIPEKHYPEVKKMIQELEADGIIVKAHTCYVNPLVVVSKPNGSLRICLDARRLNERLIPENDQPPMIKDIIRKFKDMNYFTSVDFASSYHHIQLDEKTRLLTGFLFDKNTYVFSRLPFGLKNSGAALIRALDRNLTPEVKEATVQYVDDILLASKTMEEHLDNLDKLLSNLRETGFKVNLEKSQFCQREILFLGHVIDGQGIRPNPKKIEAIQNFPRPRRIKHIRQFLGICQYFSDHCPDYTTTIAPLQELLRKNNRWKWTESQEQSFLKTKQMLTENIKLGYPDFSSEFIIQTDASSIGIGAVLYQENSRNPTDRVYLAFYSRKLKSHERNYTTTELEMLAVVAALQYWKKIVYGYPVRLRTDHKALTFMLKTTMSSERVSRWSLFVQQFNIQFEHCSGKANVLPDILSRNPDDNTVDIHHVDLVPEDHEFLRKLQYLRQSQKRDPFIRKLIDYFHQKILPGDIEYDNLHKMASDYHITNGLLHKFIDKDHSKLRIVVPVKLQHDLVWHTHRVIGHGGTDKVVATIKETFTWTRLRDTVRDLLRTCDTCQRVKYNPYLLKQYPIPLLPTKPRELFAMDLYGQITKGRLGHRYIVVTLDVFSKFLTLQPIQKANAKMILRRLNNNIIPSMGRPTFLLTDHGSQFTSIEFQRAMQHLGIKHILNSVRRPESNPSERIMAEIAKFCRIFCAGKHWDWVRVLPIISECHNSTIHESTGEIPSVVHLNKYPERSWSHLVTCPAEARPSPEVCITRTAEHLRNQADRRLRRVQKKKFHRSLREGELVLIRKPAVSSPTENFYGKFADLYIGPYKIVKAYGNNAYKVQSLDGTFVSTHNAANLKPYHTRID